MVENLHIRWLQLTANYYTDLSLADSLWQKIQKNYTYKNRYYHNLIHINSMLEKAEENKSQLTDYDELLFAIWFHDVIYKSTSKKNEEKSADFAKSTLNKMSNINIDKIYHLIISTKKHQIILTENDDNAFLLDFDLSILGTEWSVYKTYIQNIRKEYKIYPDFLYNPGRKKVLESFLNRKQLYFTEKYQDLFEENARQNLEKEFKLLS